MGGKQGIKQILFGQEEVSALASKLAQEILAEEDFSLGQIESAIDAADESLAATGDGYG